MIFGLIYLIDLLFGIVMYRFIPKTIETYYRVMFSINCVTVLNIVIAVFITIYRAFNG